MLLAKEVEEIKEHLERAQNPLFLYDNDADGFCSFVLLRRYIGRGKGVAVRTHPNVDIGYMRKVRELKADYVFVLDRPFLGLEFAEELEKEQIPLVWIDHHEVVREKYSDLVHIYNPTLHKDKSSEPVTALAYQITARKEDAWIAIMGCISDHYWPSFVPTFTEHYPELWGKVKEPFQAYYTTELGRLAKSIGFGLKDSITHVVYLQNFFIACVSPHEALAELETNSSFGKKYREMRTRYVALLERAKEFVGKKLVFFTYGGSSSISSDLSNELSYLYPKKHIIVVYTNGAISNVSIRGKHARVNLENLLPSFPGASGGGHAEAVGARIRTEDLERFKEEFEKLL